MSPGLAFIFGIWIGALMLSLHLHLRIRTESGILPQSYLERIKRDAVDRDGREEARIDAIRASWVKPPGAA